MNLICNIQALEVRELYLFIRIMYSSHVMKYYRKQKKTEKELNSPVANVSLLL